MQETSGAPLNSLLMVAAAAVAADQLSKALAIWFLEPGERVALAVPLLGLRLTRNSGGAFGLFPQFSVMFFALSVVVCVWVFLWGRRNAYRRLSLPLGMILGGGLGNLIDRLFRPPGLMRGHVVDFIDLSFWPTFNLADSAIVVGVVILIFIGRDAPGQ